jgi:hypothetical protein
MKRRDRPCRSRAGNAHKPRPVARDPAKTSDGEVRAPQMESANLEGIRRRDPLTGAGADRFGARREVWRRGGEGFCRDAAAQLNAAAQAECGGDTRVARTAAAGGHVLAYPCDTQKYGFTPATMSWFEISDP